MILNVSRLARRTVGVIWITIFVLLVGFSLFTRLAPLTGRELFIIIGGSMEPAIPIGSLVVAAPTDPMTIGVGDVVTIRADNGVVVTHRVMQVVDNADGRFFSLKGDANPSPDGGLVPARAIVGTADQYLPYAGYAQKFLSKFAGLLAVLSVLGLLWVAYMLLGMLEPPAPTVPVQAPKPAGP
jgi:signal peptidase I